MIIALVSARHLSHSMLTFTERVTELMLIETGEKKTKQTCLKINVRTVPVSPVKTVNICQCCKKYSVPFPRREIKKSSRMWQNMSSQRFTVR